MDIPDKSSVLVTTRLFQEPYSNNNVEVFLKHNTDRLLYNCQLTAQYNELNIADNNLFNYLRELNGKHYQIEAASQALDAWEGCLRQKKNLNGVYYFQNILKIFGAEGIDLVEVIGKRKASVINDFIAVPLAVKNVVRINICMGFADCSAYLEQLAANIFSKPQFFGLLDRIEIAKPRTDLLPTFPTIILYLDLSAIHKKAGIMHVFFKALDDIFSNEKRQHAIMHDYADPWNAFVNLTQGFKLYKVYLTLLGVLDHIYDSRANYAYLLNSGEGHLSRLLRHMSSNIKGIGRR